MRRKHATEYNNWESASWPPLCPLSSEPCCTLAIFTFSTPRLVPSYNFFQTRIKPSTAAGTGVICWIGFSFSRKSCICSTRTTLAAQVSSHVSKKYVLWSVQKRQCRWREKKRNLHTLWIDGRSSLEDSLKRERALGFRISRISGYNVTAYVVKYMSV